ncbi:MAG: hypothetical protein HON90_03660 [Halobacteriovoraceae bacterium]|nr:hypothetical protein [Halobacteriovoraceae bacterium]
MNKLMALLIIGFTMSCASDFNKNKRIEPKEVGGLKILKQNGKLTSRLQIYDELGRTKKEKKRLTNLKKEYALEVVGAGLGAIIFIKGLLGNDSAMTMLFGGGIFGAGYYFAMENDQQLMPYIKKHNQRKSSYFFFAPSNGEIVPAIGRHFTF